MVDPRHARVRLRTPLFIAATIMFLIAVSLEAGSGWFVGYFDDGTAAVAASVDEYLASLDLDEDDAEQAREDFDRLSAEDKPPGIGITALLAVDAIVGFGVLMRLLELVIPLHIHSRVRLVLGLILSLVVIIGGLIALFALIAYLLVMVSMFLAAPFGTIAYLAIWGSFDTGAAAGVLMGIVVAKVAYIVLLVLSQQRYLQRKMILLFWLCSLLATIVVIIMHGIVPSILVSITDCIAAIVAVIIALVLAIIELLGGLVGVVGEIKGLLQK